jgi:DNA-binding NarL/FixJ family response regulator
MLDDTEFVVVGEAESGREALKVARQVNPQLTLLDVRMADGDGLTTLTALKRAYPDMAVVMLTNYDCPTFMARSVVGGAAGYLLKGLPRGEMLAALRAVARGETLLSAHDLVRSLQAVGKQAAGKKVSASPNLIESLTDREKDVVRLLAMGLSNRDIGAVLSVAESTVKTHVKHIIWKLNVSDRVQAAVWAVQRATASPLSS